jgi:hypothetical protein
MINGHIGKMMAQFKVNKKAAITKEIWFKTRWRPSMAWLYMILIIFDFMLMPVAWPIAMFFLKIPFVAWTPLTLQGGALIHITFGAVLGLYTWGRTKELTEGTIAPSTPADPYTEESDEPIVPKKKGESNDDCLPPSRKSDT